MPDNEPRPILNPVLRLTREPRREVPSGGGKSANAIVYGRLESQRSSLARELLELARSVAEQPNFSGQVALRVTMHDDSIAPSYTPNDVFRPVNGADLIAPYHAGYLVQARADSLESLAKLVIHTGLPKEMVDISRIRSVRFFEANDATGGMSAEDLWDSAPQTETGRIFYVWFLRFPDDNAADELIRKITQIRDNGHVLSPPSIFETLIAKEDESTSEEMRRRLIEAASRSDQISVAMQEYRRSKIAFAELVMPSGSDLERVLASGVIFRVDPGSRIISSQQSRRHIADPPLPSDISDCPIVGVVDGGMTDSFYYPAEAWRARKLEPDASANSDHGNKVTSVVVQGHKLNPNLSLHRLYCRFGVAQAIAKGVSNLDLTQIVTYLDYLMAVYRDTRVWNFSFNLIEECEYFGIHPFSHAIALLARRHQVLPVISIGNITSQSSTNRMAPPSDCEAAIAVAGRQHDGQGLPGSASSSSLIGPGPAGMLKPDLSHFSTIVVGGGTTETGTSFAAPLISSLAAHTMMRLRAGSPDAAKAMLIHCADLEAFSAELGFGTPTVEHLPWECPPGLFTIQWTEKVRSGVAYYWELPIPPSLRKTGKLKGMAVLTAILNPHPLVGNPYGEDYFGARIESSLQYERGIREDGTPNFKSLFTRLPSDRLTERELRDVHNKWSPVRRHARSFPRGVEFDGDNLQIYARVFYRNLYYYGWDSPRDVPPMDAVFVLSIGTGDENDDIYGELRGQLGAFAETAVHDTDIDLESDDL